MLDYLMILMIYLNGVIYGYEWTYSFWKYRGKPGAFKNKKWRISLFEGSEIKL